MRLRMAVTLLAACGVGIVAAPLSAGQPGSNLSAGQPGSKSAKDPNEWICETLSIIGSRLTTRRVCATRAEWAEKRRLDREEIDKGQTQIGVIK